MNMQQIKNVGFISTRIAGTDGVSLEIEKWAEVLRRNRFDCFYFAGEIDRNEEISFKIEEAHFEHPDVADINKSLFGVTNRTRKISENIQKIQEKLKSTLYDFCKKFKIDLIIPENALTRAKGFDVITIDGFVTAKTIKKIRQVLEDEELRNEMVKKNYDLAKRYYSFEVLEKRLMYMISTFG